MFIRPRRDRLRRLRRRSRRRKHLPKRRHRRCQMQNGRWARQRGVHKAARFRPVTLRRNPALPLHYEQRISGQRSRGIGTYPTGLAPEPQPSALPVPLPQEEPAAWPFEQLVSATEPSRQLSTFPTLPPIAHAVSVSAPDPLPQFPWEERGRPISCSRGTEYFITHLLVTHLFSVQHRLRARLKFSMHN